MEFKNVNFSYQSKQTKPLLDNVNMSIKECSKILICGPPESGKSTLFKLLLRSYDTTNGNVINCEC